jgi:hypothetical protein
MASGELPKGPIDWPQSCALTSLAAMITIVGLLIFAFVCLWGGGFAAGWLMCMAARRKWLRTTIDELEKMSLALTQATAGDLVNKL